MKALVLGGSGFIGSHVAEALSHAGHDVVVFDRSASPATNHARGVRHLRHALSESGALRAAVANADIVYHLASSSVPKTSQSDPITDIRKNLADTNHLLETMTAVNCRRLVYFSSGGTVYGETNCQSIDESHSTKPISTHGVMKLAAEDCILKFAQATGIQPLILRVANAYGPRQKKMGVQGFINTCLQSIVGNTTVQLWGDGSSVRDYIHVTDVAELALRAGESNVRFGTFNVGSGHGVSLNDVLSAIRRITGRSVVVSHKPPRAYDVQHIVLGVERAAAAFDWSPTVSIDEGIRQLWDHLRTERPGIAVPMQTDGLKRNRPPEPIPLHI